MSARRLLIFGKGGMLAGALCRILSPSYEVVALGRSEFDIEKGDWSSLDVRGFDYVLNAAGLINRRNPDEAAYILVNSVFPQILAAKCADAGARLIHYSTDCVFAGVSGLYTESSPREAPDPYGRSKRYGEPRNALVIRTSIIGPEERIFYNLLCQSLTKQAMKGYTDHLWNGVTTVTLAEATKTIIGNDLYCEGVRHLLSNDVTKYELLQIIHDEFSTGVSVSATAAAHPRDTRLRTEHPDFLAKMRIPTLREQVRTLVPLCDERGHWN